MLDRRTFVKSTALAAFISPFYPYDFKKNSEIPIIDTHQHLWDLEQFPLSWVTPPLDRNYLIGDYMRTLEGNPYLKGIRYFFDCTEEMLHTHVIESIRVLGKMNLSFDLWNPECLGECRIFQGIMDGSTPTSDRKNNIIVALLNLINGAFMT